MKTITKTERVGELLGPVDWSYDFTKHDWANGRGGVNPEIARNAVATLRQVVELLDAGKQVMVSLYGEGHDVLAVGMYDGWPFWEPTPSVLVRTWLGSEWHPWYSIQIAKEKP
ncbi:MAG: hypothetical protein WC485_00355 [Opitutaceae bacterium]